MSKATLIYVKRGLERALAMTVAEQPSALVPIVALIVAPAAPVAVPV